MSEKFNEEEIKKLNSVDESQARGIKRKVEYDSRTLNKIVDTIVNKYSKDLDSVIDTMQNLLKNSDNLTDEQLLHYITLIPTNIYFCGAGLEQLGVEKDTAEAAKKEVYADAYMKAKGTVKDKSSEAFNVALQETFIEVAYDRAYKKLKMKIENAILVANSVKKVLDYRTNCIKFKGNKEE